MLHCLVVSEMIDKAHSNGVLAHKCLLEKGKDEGIMVKMQQIPCPLI